LRLFDDLRKALSNVVESLKHKEFKKYICFMCDKLIENDGNHENSIAGIIFDGIGGWFSEFDYIFDNPGETMMNPKVSKQIAICDKCLRAKEHLIRTVREVSKKEFMEVESGHKRGDDYLDPWF